MVSINTNLSSSIVQNNLLKSTNSLNTAIERMTTGFKINHASDNAANYSISNNYSSKLSSYSVAQDNIVSGLDLLATAQDTISLMQSHGQRIHALISQARNGTYGEQSIGAIQSEVNARIAEITRLYVTTEYNGIDLFNGIKLPDWAQEIKANAGAGAGAGAGVNIAYGVFIANPVTHTQAEVDALTHVSELSSFVSGEEYQVSTKEDLIKLAELVNSNNDTTNVTFVMGADIDLSSVENWTPIGDRSTNTNYIFKGTFDGNGHKITNLKINNPTKNYQGLFGLAESGSMIKNVGLDGEVKGSDLTGGLVGYAKGSVTNSYAAGNVTGNSQYTGGLVGYSSGSVTNSYAAGNVTGREVTGGLVGYTSGSVTNSYAAGNVTGNSQYTGGLVGYAESNITNSYATGDVTGNGQYTGGLVGYTSVNVTNSYATGAVSGNGFTGGLVGHANGNVTNSYATGNVTGTGSDAGGLAGYADTITNSYATGNVTGNGQYTGGLAGNADIVTNSYATGNVTGGNYTGGLTGSVYYTITNSYATGNVTGNDYTGGLAGFTNNTIINSYAAGNVTGAAYIGGIVGFQRDHNAIGVENCYTLGKVTGQSNVGAIIGCNDSPSGYIRSSAYNKTLNSDLSACGNDIVLTDITTLKSHSTTLQVGINGDNSSQITFESSLSLNLNLSDITSNSAYDSINTFLESLSTRVTELGAISNRLESALESTTVAIDNLTSSRSTIKDADIGKESSAYIKAQILQQASATLLATANQAPSIALQLI